MKADVKDAIEALRQEIGRLAQEVDLINARLANVTSDDSEIGRKVASLGYRVHCMEERLDSYKWTFDRIAYRNTTEGRVALVAGCDIERAKQIVEIVRADYQPEEEESE